MRNRNARFTGICMLTAVLLGTLVGAASSYYRHGGDQGVYAFGKPTASDLPPVLAPAGGTSEPVRPRIVVAGGTSHDFGIMSRNEKRSHTFVVGNQGNGPLQIRFLDKSCMCTDVTMTRTEVPPGESTEITITWQPSTFNLEFQQTARFETNDPSRIELDLNVRGKVQQVVQATPRSLSFDGVTAGQGREQSIYVFAYRDADLRVERVELLDPDTAEFFSTDVQPVDEPTLSAETGALAGQQIQVRLKPGLPLGRCYQRLRLHLNQPDLGPLEVPIVASVVGNVTLAGPGYSSQTGLWDLGKLSGNRVHTKTLLILVRGEGASDVQLNVAHVDPAEVMTAEITAGGNINTVARHTLTVTLRPADRVVNRLGSDQGELAEVVIETTHPDVPRLRLPVAFALEAQVAPAADLK